MKSKPIRLTGTSYALLAVLAEFGEMTSYDIKQAMESSIQNFWPVPHTTAYEEPARLAAAGYLAARQEEGGRRRRVYSLTDLGREVLAEWAADPEATPPQLRDEAILKLFAGGDPEDLRDSRVAWHRAKLEELWGYLELARGGEGFDRSVRTLTAGIAYHQKMLEAIDLFGKEEPHER
ncbi:MAG TPA: helix-turn-helix transcriptional regulator [Solirubrobacterales bacterium]|nr:helix-turn-helix transcriptional regulator [Solirubrobacterales bacterium]